MTDYVIEFPVKSREESQLFGDYLNAFMESRSSEVERRAEALDAPYLMMRSDPLPGMEIKVLTFQERAAARAFSAGWAKALSLAGRRSA